LKTIRLNQKKSIFAPEKHLEGIRFIYFYYFLFYESPQKSFNFLQKNGRPPWNNALKGSDFMKTYFLFYFTNAFAKISIPPLAGVEVFTFYFLSFPSPRGKRKSGGRGRGEEPNNIY